MQLQPVVMNAFSPEAATDPRQMATFGDAFDNTGTSPLMNLLGRMEEISKAQDRRIADDLKAHARSRSATAQLLSLLQLQYDLDDMQVSASMAKNIANQFSQALTTLTQRS